ncbi:MAG: hypothetical protein LBU47_05950 [Christensenellaceae bacterium]|jgi:hypothetical protein|nr:hypothetical protein [Christensenellaceae bacterium]
MVEQIIDGLDALRLGLGGSLTSHWMMIAIAAVALGFLLDAAVYSAKNRPWAAWGERIDAIRALFGRHGEPLPPEDDDLEAIEAGEMGAEGQLPAREAIVYERAEPNLDEDAPVVLRRLDLGRRPAPQGRQAPSIHLPDEGWKPTSRRRVPREATRREPEMNALEPRTTPRPGAKKPELEIYKPEEPRTRAGRKKDGEEEF